MRLPESERIARALEALEVDSEWPADRLLDAIGEAIALLRGEYVSTDQLQRAEAALREFQEGLTQALNEHGVPAMPSWREAIDYLARLPPTIALIGA